MSHFRLATAWFGIFLLAGCAMQRGTSTPSVPAPPAGHQAGYGQPPVTSYPTTYPTTEPNRSPASPSAGPARPVTSHAGPVSGPASVQPVSANLPATPPRLDLSNPSQIVARVGDEPILLGDLLGEINQMVADYEGKLPKAELDMQKEKLVQRLLEVKIDTKLMYLDFLRELPDVSRLPEIEQEVTDVFNDKQLDSLLAKANVNTRGEYDLHLRRFGSSLDKTRKDFIEQVLAVQARKGRINNDPEVTHQEMLDQYQASLKDYEVPAKVRWEVLTARFDKYTSREEAWRAIATMGNEVQGGAPFGAVAKRSSQGFKASQGGYHDWTSQGSLASEKIDNALFQLPLNQLSWIIEDDRGFHIVRVLERTPASHIPFTEAQVDIKSELRKQKIELEQSEYVTGLRERTPIWTIFDRPERTATENTPPPAGGGEFQIR